MAAQHGYPTTVLADEFDLTTYFNQTQASKITQAVDVTTYHPTNRDRTYISGIAEGTISLQGIWDGVADGVDEVLDAALGANTILTVTLGGYATLGNKCLMLQCEDAGHQIRGTVTDAVRITANAKASGGIRFGGVVLQPLEAETAVFNGTNVDNTVSTANGGVGHLHVTAFTGTNLTAKIQDSPDNSVWSDLITFSSVTGVTAERLTVTGTVDRHLRFAITAGTFTSATIFASFARHTK